MRFAAVAATVATGVAAAGCGEGEAGADGAPDGAALGEAFEQEAIAAYEADGSDRGEDFAQGVIGADCFVLDDEGATAVADALGETDTQFDDANFLHGVPGEEERLTCGLTREGEAIGISIGAGTTLADPDQARERFLRADGAVELEGEVDGLEPESVIGVEANGTLQFAWVGDDFMIGVGLPPERYEPEEGFEALGVVVAEVERTLGS